MLPHYLSIGVTKNEFMHSTPRVLKAYDKAYTKKLENLDTLAWQFCGNYVLSAVAVAVEHCLAGRKAKSEYIKEHLLKDIGLTEEEKRQKQLKEFVKKLESMQANFNANKNNQGQ